MVNRYLVGFFWVQHDPHKITKRLYILGGLLCSSGSALTITFSLLLTPSDHQLLLPDPPTPTRKMFTLWEREEFDENQEIARLASSILKTRCPPYQTIISERSSEGIKSQDEDDRIGSLRPFSGETLGLVRF